MTARAIRIAEFAAACGPRAVAAATGLTSLGAAWQLMMVQRARRSIKAPTCSMDEIGLAIANQRYHVAEFWPDDDGALRLQVDGDEYLGAVRARLFAAQRAGAPRAELTVLDDRESSAAVESARELAAAAPGTPFPLSELLRRAGCWVAAVPGHVVAIRDGKFIYDSDAAYATARVFGALKIEEVQDNAT